MKFFVINGPNLNMLGVREPAVYGKDTYADLERLVLHTAKELRVEVELIQSNHEGTLVDEIQRAYRQADGIVINPAAYTHTSIAILDALKASALPAVEVHISDVAQREAFRQVSYAGQACFYTVMGEGIAGYGTAMRILKEKLDQIAKKGVVNP